MACKNDSLHFLISGKKTFTIILPQNLGEHVKICQLQKLKHKCLSLVGSDWTMFTYTGTSCTTRDPSWLGTFLRYLSLCILGGLFLTFGGSNLIMIDLNETFKFKIFKTNYSQKIPISDQKSKNFWNFCSTQSWDKRKSPLYSGSQVQVLLAFESSS